MTAFVDIQDVSLVYKGQQKDQGTLAVEHLNLQVAKGEFVAVVGPSGCGKSTLMKLATGLHFPNKGRVVVDDKPVDGPVSITGMAFQNPVMLPWRLTRDNILLPLEIVRPHRQLIRRKRREYEERADQLLTSVGLEGAGDQYPWQLSGGMQQRASLCRALIHDPQLLLLDEPFAALDAFTREELWCVMHDLHHEKKFTTILVTHDLREAVFLADTVHVMSARPGQIIAERKIPFSRPRSIEVTYESQFAELTHELRSHIAEARG